MRKLEARFYARGIEVYKILSNFHNAVDCQCQIYYGFTQSPIGESCLVISIGRIKYKQNCRDVMLQIMPDTYIHNRNETEINVSLKVLSYPEFSSNHFLLT